MQLRNTQLKPRYLTGQLPSFPSRGFSHHLKMIDAIKVLPLVLDGDDKSWASSMRALLITHQRFDKLLDAEPQDNDAEGKENGVLCKAPLQLRVHGPLKAILERAKTAIAVWDALNKDKVDTLRVRQPY
jgi:hypothetical protein